MRKLLCAATTLLACALGTPGAHAADPNKNAEPERLPWLVGPAEGKIGQKAIVKLSEKNLFLDEAGTKRFLELTGNPPRDQHYTVAPKQGEWFVIFAFDPIGYVKDDEAIDADALLKSMQESDEPGNEERKKLGMTALYTDGWHVSPHYDKAAQRLEWGLRLRDGEGKTFVNYSTRLLGRSGVMKATLVTDPRALEADLVPFKEMLKDFEYVPGERYAEFKEGDKMATYGLAALIAGGAAAAAAKGGLFKGLGKGLIFIAVAAGGLILGLLKKLFARKERETPQQ
jgi:uncharacterized membrane-anchored protein